MVAHHTLQMFNRIYEIVGRVFHWSVGFRAGFHHRVFFV